MVKNLLFWVGVALLLMMLFSNFGPRPVQPEKIAFSDLVQLANNDNIERIAFDPEQLRLDAITRQNKVITTRVPSREHPIIDYLSRPSSPTLFSVKDAPQPNQFLNIFISWFPILLFIGVWMYFMRQMQGGGGRGAMTFGKSKARMLGEGQVKVTFADVAGVDEAKEEVGELVEYLKDPEKFQKLGGRIPRGILMVGQPGTGKTLLAKAIAGEAKVPFFTISGSDFVEMFVGVGASRVRDMFEQAKKHSPCIIFIDEIDAVGRHRGAGLGGGHDEREQTLNQLLVEMDGFEGNEGVIVIAATNRPDVLDKALLRPGRFDRQVVVSLPDILGREQILKVHMRKLPIADDVDAKVIARGTPGFSGADLANLINEAALMAARHNKRIVDMKEFEFAKDKIMMGAERHSMVMNEKEKKLTAYHESGHTIVGLLVEEHDPVYKVTIIPRAQALGVTMFLPEQDRYSHSKKRLESQMCVLFGGRIAEELIFGAEYVTTGASNDIQRSTDIARRMVTRWGLSEKLGPQTFGEDDGEVFLGHSVNQRKEFSGNTAMVIDEEVKSLVDRNYQQAKDILVNNMDKLHSMSEALLKYETLDIDQIRDIMDGKEPSEPKNWQGGNNGSDSSSHSESDDKDSQVIDKDLKSQNDERTMDDPAQEH